MKSIITFWKRLFINRYYTEEGMPIKCEYCDDTVIYEETMAIDGGYVSEFSCICTGCKEEIGYWAYGYYNPNYRENAFK